MERRARLFLVTPSTPIVDGCFKLPREFCKISSHSNDVGLQAPEEKVIVALCITATTRSIVTHCITTTTTTTRSITLCATVSTSSTSNDIVLPYGLICIPSSCASSMRQGTQQTRAMFFLTINVSVFLLKHIRILFLSIRIRIFTGQLSAFPHRGLVDGYTKNTYQQSTKGGAMQISKGRVNNTNTRDASKNKPSHVSRRLL